jgi:hypothetical protein
MLMAKRKRRKPKNPNAKDRTTGQFISRKEKEKQIMATTMEPPNPTVPIPTEEEIMAEIETEAMDNEIMESKFLQHPQMAKQAVQKKLQSHQENQKQAMEKATEIPIEKTGKTITSKEPSQPTPTTAPATSTSIDLPQKETKDCSPVSQGPDPAEMKGVDPEFTMLAEYVLQTVTETYILAQMGAILSNPGAIPPLHMWKPEIDIDIPKVIHSIINQPGYLQQVYPRLRILMGTSFSNLAWTANVLITIAFFDMVRILPQSRYLKGV